MFAVTNRLPHLGQRQSGFGLEFMEEDKRPISRVLLGSFQNQVNRAVGKKSFDGLPLFFQRHR